MTYRIYCDRAGILSATRDPEIPSRFIRQQQDEHHNPYSLASRLLSGARFSPFDTRNTKMTQIADMRGIAKLATTGRNQDIEAPRHRTLQ